MNACKSGKFICFAAASFAPRYSSDVSCIAYVFISRASCFRVASHNGTYTLPAPIAPSNLLGIDRP